MFRDAFEWIWEKVLELFPFSTMDAFQRGVRLLCGRPVMAWRWAFWREREVAVIQPGICLSLPFIHRIIEVDVTPRTLSVMPVPVTSKDGVPLKLGGNIRFEVSDVRKWVLEVHDAKLSLLNDGESVLATFGSTLTWRNDWNVGHVNKRLAGALRKKVADYGVNILGFDLNCFVEVRPYQVFGDSSGAPLFDGDE